MNKFLTSLLFVACLISCKNKKLDSTKAYFSIVDYIGGEIKKMDTLPLHFIKITTTGNISDTISITKKEFYKYAKEFTGIPDIASRSKMNDYDEANDFDEVLNNVLLMYTAKNQQDEVRSETIMMQPDDQGNTHVKTILATTLQADKDSGIEKNLTWHIDKRFQVVTKVNKPNQPEKITTVVISWK